MTAEAIVGDRAKRCFTGRWFVRKRFAHRDSLLRRQRPAEDRRDLSQTNSLMHLRGWAGRYITGARKMTHQRASQGVAPVPSVACKTLPPSAGGRKLGLQPTWRRT